VEAEPGAGPLGEPVAVRGCGAEHAHLRDPAGGRRGPELRPRLAAAPDDADHIRVGKRQRVDGRRAERARAGGPQLDPDDASGQAAAGIPDEDGLVGLLDPVW